MIIEVKTKDENGNITFDGKLNSVETSTVLNIGINYLLARGCIPSFTGIEDNDITISKAPTTTQ
jgi:hypothetical protein